MCEGNSEDPNIDLLEDEHQVPPSLAPLLNGERRALELLRARKEIDLSANDLPVDDPSATMRWDESRQIRGRFLEWLISESALCSNLAVKRVAVVGTQIIGVLDLSFRTISIYLSFRQSNIQDGIRIVSSRLVGLEFKQVSLGRIGAWAAVIDGPLLFEQAKIAGTVHLPNARIVGDLSITQSTIDADGVSALHAPNLMIQGNLSVEKSHIFGGVNLVNASVAGLLRLSGGRVDHQSGIAVHADGINVSGRCHIRDGIEINGTVRLISAKIGGEFNLGTAKITKPGQSEREEFEQERFAVDARNARIGGPAYLNNGFYALGKVAFNGAEIGGGLGFRDARVENAPDPALDLASVTVKGSVGLSGRFVANGAILLYGATIGGDLNCDGAQLSKGALDAARCELKGSVYLTKGFTSDNPILLFGASIGGDIVLAESKVSGSDKALDLGVARATTLRIADSTVKGSVHLVGAEFNGDIWVRHSTLNSSADLAISAYNVRAQNFVLETNSTVQGSVALGGAEFNGDILVKNSILESARNQRAISADNVRARSFVLDEQSTVKGPVSLYGAKLNAAIDVRASFDPRHNDEVVFNAHSAHCDGDLIWQCVGKAPSGIVNLEQAHVGGLRDRLESWPKQLRLDGFTYDRLVGDAPKKVCTRLEWLKRQDRYYSQPFEQLIAVYRRLGESDSAAEVAICKWRSRREEMPKLRWHRCWDLRRLWDWFLDVSSGYGYRPWRPLVGLLSVLLVGTAVYWSGADHDAFCAFETLKSQHPCEKLPQYPRFNPFAYSIEALLPVGEFGQRRFYVLRGDVAAAVYLGWYTLVHRFLGSVFSLLLALAPTNVLRRE
jgi:hypothetical protein